MRESYEKIRSEVEEIMDLFKKKLIEEGDLFSCDPDLLVLLARSVNMLKASDQFTLACISAMEDQNEKLNRILNKLN